MKKMIYKPKLQKNTEMNYPNEGEIVEVYQCETYERAFNVVGYETAKDGTGQSFEKYNFREINLTKQLADSFIEKDSKVREQEHEKVFDLTREF